MSRNETQKYEQLLQECDLLIKSGKINSVATLISKLNLVQVPRQHKQSLAKIFRRTGLISQGIRLLHPIIRHNKELVQPPTPSEICEYAALISRIGLIKESLDLLKNVNPNTNSEALLYSGFCYVSNWDYIEAQKYFEQYLTLQIDEYSRLIAKVNLSACYIGSGQLSKAAILIDESLQLSYAAKSKRLQGNCLEMRGQMNVLNFNFLEAKKNLNLAKEIFISAQSYDSLLTDKWQSIIAAFESRSIEPLLFFRKRAENQKHWESVRESDLFRTRIEFNQKIFDQLIFGTPSRAYQNRAYELINRNASEKMIWGDPKSKHIDLVSFTDDSAFTSNTGKKMHQMLQALLNDLYAPRNTASLFSEVYPDECFNIDSSPYKIRQIIRRLRTWFNENSYNADIKYENGHGYRLEIKNGFSFLLNKNQKNSVIVIEDLFYNKLKNVFQNKSFTINEACSKLNISESGFHRFVRKTLAQGLIKKSGKARSTVYTITDKALTDIEALVRKSG